MRQKTLLHLTLSWSLTVAILFVTGVLGCHHSFGNPAWMTPTVSPSEAGSILAPEETTPLPGADRQCALCASQRLLNQSCAEEIHDLSVPGQDTAIVVGGSTHPTVSRVDAAGARSPPLS
jgi:hypothetical protein